MIDRRWATYELLSSAQTERHTSKFKLWITHGYLYYRRLLGAIYSNDRDPVWSEISGSLLSPSIFTWIVLLLREKKKKTAVMHLEGAYMLSSFYSLFVLSVLSLDSSSQHFLK